MTKRLKEKISEAVMDTIDIQAVAERLGVPVHEVSLGVDRVSPLGEVTMSLRISVNRDDLDSLKRQAEVDERARRRMALDTIAGAASDVLPWMFDDAEIDEDCKSLVLWVEDPGVLRRLSYSIDTGVMTLGLYVIGTPRAVEVDDSLMDSISLASRLAPAAHRRVDNLWSKLANKIIEERAKEMTR